MKRKESQQTARRRVFFGSNPDANNTDYTAWIRRNSDAFRESRHIYADTIPPDLQDDFTDWLRLQCMETAE